MHTPGTKRKARRNYDHEWEAATGISGKKRKVAKDEDHGSGGGQLVVRAVGSAQRKATLRGRKNPLPKI